MPPPTPTNILPNKRPGQSDRRSRKWLCMPALKCCRIQPPAYVYASPWAAVPNGWNGGRRKGAWGPDTTAARHARHMPNLRARSPFTCTDALKPVQSSANYEREKEKKGESMAYGNIITTTSTQVSIHRHTHMYCSYNACPQGSRSLRTCILDKT